MESESELRSTESFELIFPVAPMASKYLKFFDDSLPLERKLANSALARDKSSAPRGTRLEGWSREARRPERGHAELPKGQESKAPGVLRRLALFAS